MLRDFIGIYDDVLSKEECDKVITDYENVSPLSGRKNYGIDNIAKKLAETLYCDLKEDLFNDFNIPVRSALGKGLPEYKEMYSFLEKQGLWDVDRYYNVQRYKEGEGYFTLHCEHQASDPYRMLVWMIFLNDAECGTEFPYQDQIVDAKVGRLVLWPAGWSHPHKGVTPNRGLKYIATGWYSYNEK